MTGTAVNVSYASSEALFGSASRGEQDDLSDRDILIVDDNVEVLTARASQLSDEGASVASYTFAKLKALARQGALFLQHLKLESRITTDRNGRLADLLTQFQPKDDYTSEIAENRKLAALAGTVPVGPRGSLFAADVLYVAVRNFGVLTLAQQGVHVFAFHQVVAEMAKAGLIAERHSALSSLRFLKCLYRSGERADAGTGDSAVEKAVRDALAILPSDHFPTEFQLVEPQAIVFARHHGNRSPYLELRDLERRWLALNQLEPDLVPVGRLMKLQSWIQNPRAYSSISARLAPALRRDIERMSARRAIAPHLAGVKIIRRR